ncbi:uncharacterized protein LOC5507829 isoform X2 [Nematostella vectensis]|uniref:uncharacterized protein LOC5507829 isoform X2 n=1 Tax=Nematostella vectensis TaxID=45351 RepID=UPI00207719A1|nr:uncharacterized protein LOC5507829 isoform X2 [Nematostella vectensis]
MYEKRFLTLDNLNTSIRDFDYGYSDAANKPSLISSKILNSGTNSLKQRASQMWCLGRFLPLMIGSHIPGDDEKWQLFIILLEIVSIIFAEVITKDKAAHLRDLITDHHTRFATLYPECSIIPKMHYILHYPLTIVRKGPMIRTWTMRFEAKHERLKRLDGSLGNFTNIPWTLSLRHQLRQCYELSGSRHGHPPIEKSLEVGPGPTGVL